MSVNIDHVSYEYEKHLFLVCLNNWDKIIQTQKISIIKNPFLLKVLNKRLLLPTYGTDVMHLLVSRKLNLKVIS